jgi:hypothetical protein
VAFAGGVVLLSTTAVVAATGNGGRLLEAVGLKPGVEVAEPAPPPKPDRPAPVRRQVAPVEAPEPVVEQPAASACESPKGMAVIRSRTFSAAGGGKTIQQASFCDAPGQRINMNSVSFCPLRQFDGICTRRFSSTMLSKHEL